MIKSRKSLWNALKLVGFLSLFVLMSIVVIHKFIQKNNDPLAITQNYIYIEPLTSYWRKDHNFHTKIDYQDYEYMEREKSLWGKPGENGQPVYPEKDEEELNKKLFDVNGYSGLVSDKIALNRSVADFRHPECQKIKYLADLPTVSIVIPFYNDHLSTLLRTVYSVVNRSPKHLLKEVILVNDHSTKEFLYKELDNHIKEHFKGLVKLLVLPRRSGLIWARLAGARAAVGDVLLFIDSHTEASPNFLPPLLEPIAKNYRTCVCPFIDVIDFNTFAYRPQGDGSRGIFDWRLSFKSMPLRPGDQPNKWNNYENPVMVGGLFAISAKFFWELGGYDPGLDIWGVSCANKKHKFFKQFNCLYSSFRVNNMNCHSKFGCAVAKCMILHAVELVTFFEAECHFQMIAKELILLQSTIKELLKFGWTNTSITYTNVNLKDTQRQKQVL